jgi:anaphase-promoting complex subunit 4
VGWSDGVVRLLGLENSKAVHQIPVCGAGKTKITCIGWARNHAGKRPVASTKDAASAWHSLSLQGLNVNEKQGTLDLPRELAFLEVETALPKLSPLPASGGSGYDITPTMGVPES